MNILLTGGAGFIGSHLAEKLLADGYNLTIVDDFNDYYDPRLKRQNVKELKEAQIFEVDIRNSEKLDRIFSKTHPDLIIHLAGRAGVRPSIKEPMLYSEVNVTATINLLELAKKYNIKKFIFASSSSVYGNADKVPFSEDDDPIQPISPYGATKLAAEYYCSVYNKLYGISIVALRFFTVYGPRQRPDMAIHKFARLISAGKEIEMYGDGSTKRDYTFISDIIGGIYGAIKSVGNGFSVYNLGESRTVQLRYLIKLLGKNIGKKAKIKKLPDQPGDVKITYANISKARKELRYNPRVPIEIGISEFVKWFKNVNKS